MPGPELTPCGARACGGAPHPLARVSIDGPVEVLWFLPIISEFSNLINYHSLSGLLSQRGWPLNSPWSCLSPAHSRAVMSGDASRMLKSGYGVAGRPGWRARPPAKLLARCPFVLHDMALSPLLPSVSPTDCLQFGQTRCKQTTDRTSPFFHSRTSKVLAIPTHRLEALSFCLINILGGVFGVP